MASEKRTSLLETGLLLILGGFALAFLFETTRLDPTAALFPRLVAGASLFLFAIALGFRFLGSGITAVQGAGFIAEKKPQNAISFSAALALQAGYIVGDLIPTFTFGIPGSSVAAIFLAAMTMHGLQPGVQFFERSGTLPYTVFIGILLAQFSFFGWGLVLARHIIKTVLIPNELLLPAIVMLSFVASFAMRGYVEDVIVALVFGFIGYLLTRYRYPTSCMVLGLVLGDLVEANFHRSLLIGRGSYAIFFIRPIALTILLLTAIALVWSSFKTWARSASPIGRSVKIGGK